jgi:hypothetical protein
MECSSPASRRATSAISEITRTNEIDMAKVVRVIPDAQTDAALRI